MLSTFFLEQQGWVSLVLPVFQVFLSILCRDTHTHVAQIKVTHKAVEAWRRCPKPGPGAVKVITCEGEAKLLRPDSKLSPATFTFCLNRRHSLDNLPILVSTSVSVARPARVGYPGPAQVAGLWSIRGGRVISKMENKWLFFIENGKECSKSYLILH